MHAPKLSIARFSPQYIIRRSSMAKVKAPPPSRDGIGCVDFPAGMESEVAQGRKRGRSFWRLSSADSPKLLGRIILPTAFNSSCHLHIACHDICSEPFWQENLRCSSALGSDISTQIENLTYKNGLTPSLGLSRCIDATSATITTLFQQ